MLVARLAEDFIRIPDRGGLCFLISWLVCFRDGCKINQRFVVGLLHRHQPGFDPLELLLVCVDIVQMKQTQLQQKLDGCIPADAVLFSYFCYGIAGRFLHTDRELFVTGHGEFL